MPFKHGNVLVTGASGFIGSHLTESLVNEGADVCVLVRDEMNNIAHLKDSVKVVKGDILDNNLDNIVPKDTDAIYHLAASSSVSECIEHPKECTKINILGTQNILELARKLDSKFYMASSSYVYGDVASLPVKENVALRPTSPLGAAKASAEYLTKAYHDCYDVSSVILRIFTVYGPRSLQHQFIPFLINQALTKKVITLGNPKPTRDFIYVKDICDAFLCAYRAKGFDIFNVGTGVETNVKDLVDKIVEISGKDLRLVFKAKPRADERKSISRQCADNSKAREILKWMPETSLDSGLRLTYKYYKSLRS